MSDKSSFYNKFQLWFWGIFAFIGVLIISLFVLIGIEFFGPLPTFEELENPKSNLASEVYTEDHELFHYYYKDFRHSVDFEELSPNLIDALIATEDIRFYRHSGI